MEKDPNKFRGIYRIPEARLKGFDYGSNAIYLVTICTKERIQYFGNFQIAGMQNSVSLQYTEIGKIANRYWLEIPSHYPFVALNEFIVMPNHIHGILAFQKDNYNEWNPNKFGVQSQNLAAVIRAYKSSVKRFANQNKIDFEWQSRFHDRIVRNDEELKRIQIYIQKNPENWKEDRYNQS